jgi:hypothetical protein
LLGESSRCFFLPFLVNNVGQAMNSLLTQASPSLRPTKQGEGGAGGGNRAPRGSAGRSRGRGRGSSSRLASAKSITVTDLSSPATPVSLPNGEGSFAGSAESADDSESSRQERFNKTDPGNQYEQVCFPLFQIENSSPFK